ncbi:MAG: outer membrane protein assembly factor BamD [Chromatiales bacterium 21-64-14]|nr:MAG: outer membrane protein assembly factor BamD [Chromatiales bacterium 21-64-14]
MFAAACLLLSLSGCAMFGKTADKTKNWPVAKLYAAAMDASNSGNYETAINYFGKLEARFPFGRYAQQAQLEIAYAYYKQGESDSAIAEAKRFIKMYPRNPGVDYAFYLIGITEYNRGQGFIQRLMDVDRTRRDQGAAHKSFQAFGELLRRFPHSRYAEDARERMIYLRNSLAAHEIHVARYYMNRSAYVAAVDRAKYVLDHYQETPSTPEALIIMVEGYRRMGLVGPANNAYQVLKVNFPKNPAVARLETQPAK